MNKTYHHYIEKNNKRDNNFVKKKPVVKVKD